MFPTVCISHAGLPLNLMPNNHFLEHFLNIHPRQQIRELRSLVAACIWSSSRQRTRSRPAGGALGRGFRAREGRRLSSTLLRTLCHASYLIAHISCLCLSTFLAVFVSSRVHTCSEEYEQEYDYTTLEDCAFATTSDLTCEHLSLLLIVFAVLPHDALFESRVISTCLP